MGWYYSHDLSYGIIVKARNCPHIEGLLEKYKHIIDYRDYNIPSNQGTYGEQIFVYLRSAEKELNFDSGSYASSHPDSKGTPFKAPKHPCFEKQPDNPPPSMTQEEQDCLDEIENKCTTFPLRHTDRKRFWSEVAFLH